MAVNRATSSEGRVDGHAEMLDGWELGIICCEGGDEVLRRDVVGLGVDRPPGGAFSFCDCWEEGGGVADGSWLSPDTSFLVIEVRGSG